MAMKDKLVNLEDLKAVNDHVEDEVSGLRSAIEEGGVRNGN